MGSNLGEPKFNSLFARNWLWLEYERV